MENKMKDLSIEDLLELRARFSTKIIQLQHEAHDLSETRKRIDIHIEALRSKRANGG